MVRKKKKREPRGLDHLQNIQPGKSQVRVLKILCFKQGKEKKNFLVNSKAFYNEGRLENSEEI